MADERLVPVVVACAEGHERLAETDQTEPRADAFQGPDNAPTSPLKPNKIQNEDKSKTPPTVVKRKKPVDISKFNQTNIKSKNCATFYFKHHDTDSDRQMIETDAKSQAYSSDEELTGPKIANEDSTDLMTSSVEIADDKRGSPPSPTPDLGSPTPDLLRGQDSRCKDIERLVIQAEKLVQKQAQQQMAKKKGSRIFKPLAFEDEGKLVTRAKISRIKEWLNQNSEDNEKNDCNQGNESYDASGEYTTESEVDNSMTSEEHNIHSSMDMSTSTCTVTPTHHAKVQLRQKRAGNSTRPWSVSCLSQLSGAGASLATPSAADVAAMSHIMSISESALNTLATQQTVTPANSNSKLRGSSTTVQGHISSTNTVTEACTSCVEASEKVCWLRHQRLRARRRGAAGGGRRERLVKSRSFSGRLSPERERSERSAASDPNCIRKTRFDTSTSGNDSDEEPPPPAHLRRSTEPTHAARDPHSVIPEQSEGVVSPSFKLGPAGGPVRPRLAKSMERERTYLTHSLGDPGCLWDLNGDNSDADKSVTAGTEEHSSFSEQAWDFYQEKYSSEPYSEAPDTDAARRLLEFGDDYRAFLDSQSDCCSSLSAARDPPRARRPPADAGARKPKRAMSSAERKKSLLDSLERSRNHTSLESGEGARRRHPPGAPGPAAGRRRHHSHATSDEVNSSLEYAEANHRPDLLESVARRRRPAGGGSELAKVARSELRRRSTEGEPARWDSDSEGEEARALVRRSGAQLDACEARLRRDADYTEISSQCRENISLLDAALARGSLSPAMQRDVRDVSCRWSALRAAATRRSSARRLRRELSSLRATLADVCDSGDGAPRPHTRAHLNRRVEELKERLFQLLEIKVSMLKLTVSVRRALGDADADDGGLSADLAGLLTAWDDAHQRTFDELISLERVVCAWAEWENALRELQGALVGDLATLKALKSRGPAAQGTEVAAQIRQLAALLVDKKSGSTCDSVSDSGISDGDSEAVGGRARRLSALRELARRLQAALAPGSPAHRAITKRMEQTENEVRNLQESCRALVEQTIPHSKAEGSPSKKAVVGTKAGPGEPDHPRGGGWVWRVVRASLPVQLCLVALLLAAWLAERPRCCDALNSLAHALTPQLRYVRGPPPV